MLAQDFGLIGRLVAEHRLGLAVDACDARRLAAGITLMTENGADGFIDRSAARALAAAQTPTGFARSIFAAIFGPAAVDETDRQAERAARLTASGPRWAARRLKEWAAP